MKIVLSYEECTSYVRDVIENHPSYPDMSMYWMVFDLDDTLITDINYRNTYTCTADIFKFQYRSKHDPIDDMVNLYNWCVSLGMKMCIITARGISLREATEKNIVSVGIRKCHRLYMKSTRMDTSLYKTQCRNELDSDILFNIGDKEADIVPTGTVDRDPLHNILLPSTY